MEISPAGVAIIIGALIGTGSSLLSTYLRQKKQSKRELTKIAYEMAIKEYETLLKSYEGTDIQIQPIESFVSYYLKYFELIKVKKVKIEDLEKLRKFREELNSLYKKE